MPAKVYHLDLYGKREEKYNWLENNTLENFQELTPVEPYYFFVPKDFSENVEYEKGFKVDELFNNFNTGIQTKCDDLSIKFNLTDLEKVVFDFQNLSIHDLKNKYRNKEDSSGWNFQDAVNDLRNNKISYTKILYRPFDIRHTLFTGKSSGFIGRPRTETMRHFLNPNNYGLITLRINGEGKEFVILVTKNVVEKGSLPRGNYSVFPLYLYSDLENLEGTTKTPNLDATIWMKISESVGRETTPEEVLDYIYAVLHSPSYREKYREFLKIDFPRVPYPASRKQFEALVKLGGELRTLHLLESPKVEEYITTFPVAGSGEVEKVAYVDGRVYINSEQYFGDVPEVAWNFYIGGYQPAQKWLKDRKGRTLTWEDIVHYQSMIVALTETARVMGEEVDRVLEEV